MCSQAAVERTQGSVRGDPMAALGCPLPDISVVRQGVDDYLRYLHNRPHTLFHPPTLKRAVIEETLDEALLLAICSLGFRFSDNPAIRQLGLQYCRASSSLMHRRLEQVSLENVQTYILLANAYSAESEPVSEALYLGS